MFNYFWKKNDIPSKFRERNISEFISYLGRPFWCNKSYKYNKKKNIQIYKYNKSYKIFVSRRNVVGESFKWNVPS